MFLSLVDPDTRSTQNINPKGYTHFKYTKIKGYTLR